MNTEYIKTQPKEVLSLSLSDELWSGLDQSVTRFLNGSIASEQAFEDLYNDVITLSREISDFLWTEFLALAYSLKHFIEMSANPLIIRDRHKLYVLTSNNSAFSISEQRFLGEEEHRLLMMNEAAVHYTLLEYIKYFYEEVSEYHRRKKDLVSLKKSQSFVINFDPRDIEWLASRGITNMDLHYYTEALNDLKKYIFMTDGKNTSSTVKSALMELQGLKALETLKTVSNH